MAEGGRLGILLGGGMFVRAAADVVRLMPVRPVVDVGGLRDMVLVLPCVKNGRSWEENGRYGNVTI